MENFVRCIHKLIYYKRTDEQNSLRLYNNNLILRTALQGVPELLLNPPPRPCGPGRAGLRLAERSQQSWGAGGEGDLSSDDCVEGEQQEAELEA